MHLTYSIIINHPTLQIHTTQRQLFWMNCQVDRGFSLSKTFWHEYHRALPYKIIFGSIGDGTSVQNEWNKWKLILLVFASGQPSSFFQSWLSELTAPSFPTFPSEFPLNVLPLPFLNPNPSSSLCLKVQTRLHSFSKFSFFSNINCLHFPIAPFWHFIGVASLFTLRVNIISGISLLRCFCYIDYVDSFALWKFLFLVWSFNPHPNFFVIKFLFQF